MILLRITQIMTSYYHPHIILIILVCLASLTPAFSDLSADRSALLRLREAVRGRTLLWNTTLSSPCAWLGVRCDNTTNNERVTALRLPGTSLTGQLPLNTIGNLTELRTLSLRENSLSGPLPVDLASCTQLTDLHLQGNNFSGEIQASFFTLRNLVRVNLGRNNFTGALLSGFNNLTNLRMLFLENNQFTGSLPDLSSVTGLRRFNVSFNELNGPIPSSLNAFSYWSFLGTSLCGGPLVSCPGTNGDGLSGGAIAGIVVGAFAVLILVLVVLFVSWRKHRKVNVETLPQIDRSPNPNLVITTGEDELSSNTFSSEKCADERPPVARTGNDGLVFFGENVEIFGLHELLQSSAEVMGKGTVGSTYKAYLHSGVELVVKRMKNVCVSEKDFRDKIEEAGSLVYENLGSIKGYLYDTNEKLVLYEPMPNGSLSALLHGDKKPPLSWGIRAKIALESASGIEYLHSIGTAHGNIKSSNIFVTGNYEARVSEFSLTQLVSPISELNGYLAPEVYDTREASHQADVYSFGVVLLELLTGKAPDQLLTADGIGLADWVRSVAREKWTTEVFDPELIRYEIVDENTVRSLLYLAVSCTDQRPEERPSMVEVTRRIEETFTRRL